MTARRLAVVSILFANACAASGATSLADLLAEAARANPDIGAALRAWQAAAQTGTQVSTLPDPQVTVQQFAVGSPRPFAGFTNSSFAYIGFGVSQDLPYPGKLRLRAEAAERDTAAAREKYESARRVVFQQTKAAYFQLAYLAKTLDVLRRDQALLDQIEFIAQAHYRVGQGTQEDILKAQLQKTRMLEEIAEHHGLMASGEAQMKKLLNRPQDSPDIEPADLIETPLNYTSGELLDKVRTQNPDVAGEREMVKKQSLSVEMARKDRYPDFSVQYMWQHTAEQYRDYYMLSFSARVPIYRKRKLDPELAQATSELDESRREYESRVQQAYFDVRDQYIAADTASQILKIDREGLIPQSLATFRAGLAAYQAGKQGFETPLSAFLDVLKLDEQYWKTLAAHETAIARMEQITGAEIR